MSKDKMKCPYCGAEVLLKDISYVYHKSKMQDKLKGEKVWVCSNYPTCNSYVRCQKGTDIPLGRIANARLRTLRAEAHKQFDMIWKSGTKSRQDSYIWLSKQLNIDVSECHIGSFDVKLCQKTIHICEDFSSPKLDRYRKENS